MTQKFKPTSMRQSLKDALKKALAERDGSDIENVRAQLKQAIEERDAARDKLKVAEETLSLSLGCHHCEDDAREALRKMRGET